MDFITKRIALCLFACLLLLLSSCTSSPASAAGEQNHYPVYKSYTDIPGVTREEIDAIEVLKSRRDSFVVAMNYSTEAFYGADGGIDGYTSLFCAWLSNLFGVQFKPDIVEWDDLISGLADHSIDFTGELTATDERRKTYFMTDAIAERSVKNFRMRDSQKISEIASERMLFYAFLDGSTAAGYLEESSDYDFATTYVQDYDEAVRLMRGGFIDAFFEDGSAEAAFDNYEDIVAQETFPLIYTSVSLSSANPELAPIVAVVQKYLDHGAIYHLTELYNRGEAEYRRHKLYIRLSEEEREYLGRGKAIPVAAEYDNYPVSFYNKTENEWQGIAFDVLDEISKLTGLTFTIMNEPDTNWPELLAALGSGRAALITELIPSKERQGYFLWPDAPYCVDNFALISRSEQDNIKVNQIWYSSVALPADTAYEEIFDKWFPNHQHTKRFDATYDCYLAVETGELDFAMTSRNSMLGMTNYSEKPGFKVNILFDNTYDASFGLNINESVLCSIISKAQSQIDMKSITNHWIHRVFDYRAKLARSQIPYLIGLAVMLVLILTLLFLFLLRNKRIGRELEQLVRQRTQELEIQTVAAQQASRAKSDFLSQMSHEIRTPLNAIIGMAQIGRMVPNVPEKAQKAIDEITSASHHLLGVLNDILDMAKIESGKFALSEEPFAFLPAMREVAEIFEQRCREKDLDFATDFGEGLDIGVSGDKLRIKQVLINLLGNAVKFTPNGGRVGFTVQRLSEHDSGSGAEILFSIEDNGIGMTEEQISKLFVAFGQADPTISVKYGGTGLGLAISQKMLDKMGGQIQVESKPGEGSRFWFTLTLAKAELPNETDAAVEAPNLAGRRILLAEDVEVNRLILAELFADSGVEIEEAENGQEAYDRFRSTPEGYFDLILMDIQMPLMNGYDTTRAIRALPRNDAKMIPIVAMTANAFSEDVEKARESGMNAHVAKPIDVSVMWQTLDQVWDKERI